MACMYVAGSLLIFDKFAQSQYYTVIAYTIKC